MTEVIRARPTVYKGIRMRSRLEADYAGYLDREKLPWEYEPECFASPEGQWLPDFRISGTGLIELKPAGRLADDYMSGEIDKHLGRMTVAWASVPAAPLFLIYWKHGGLAVMIIHSERRGAPWLIAGQIPRPVMPLLWTGMGQYARCETS